jgi:hypothetical protein
MKIVLTDEAGVIVTNPTIGMKVYHRITGAHGTVRPGGIDLKGKYIHICAPEEQEVLVVTLVDCNYDRNWFAWLGGEWLDDEEAVQYVRTNETTIEVPPTLGQKVSPSERQKFHDFFSTQGEDNLGFPPAEAAESTIEFIERYVDAPSHTFDEWLGGMAFTAYCEVFSDCYGQFPYWVSAKDRTAEEWEVLTNNIRLEFKDEGDDPCPC